MADNYLEKKMEEFREGKKAVRRPSASVEGLLKHISEPSEASADTVMGAQLEAVVRAAKHLPEAESFRFDIDEKAAAICLLGPGSPRRYLLEAGELVLAMRMKAAELHLNSRVEPNPESTAPANPLLATVFIWK